MPRGSMPGERRGGRTRATPNRRTILADRMMAVLDGCSKASPKERLSKLIDDAELPPDIRMAVAQMAYADRAGGVRRARRGKTEIHTVGRTQQREPRAIVAPSASSLAVETMSPAARDALLGVVSDASASAKARRKAAMNLATYFLPKKPVNKRWRFTADECGFAINAEIAREYRAIDFELRDLKRQPSRDFPEIAQRIRKLQARFDAIRQRLQCPPPKDDGDEDTIRQRLQGPPPIGYGDKELLEDWTRLETFARKRKAGIALSTEEDAEEAHRNARFDCYAEGPEQTARRRRQQLEAADKYFRENRFFKDLTPASLSRKERNDLWLLRWLYPPPHSKSRLSDEAQAAADANKAIDHPFGNKKPAADGKFYPHDSKLRPSRYYEIVIIDDEEVEIPPYYICNSGQPPYFTYELPNNPSSEKSDPTQPSLEATLIGS
jgi:hypothetical protein